MSPLCKYCGLSAEKVSHLYWLCPIVNSFLEETFNYIKSTGLNYNPTKLEFLFGIPNVSSEHPKNYLSLLIKKFIWKTKFKNAFLSVVGLKTFVKMWLIELKVVYEIKEQALKFNEWIMLYNDLCQVPQDAVHLLPPQASPVRDLLLQAAGPLPPGASVQPAQLLQAVQDPPESGVQD